MGHPLIRSFIDVKTSNASLKTSTEFLHVIWISPTEVFSPPSSACPRTSTRPRTHHHHCQHPEEGLPLILRPPITHNPCCRNRKLISGTSPHHELVLLMVRTWGRERSGRAGAHGKDLRLQSRDVRLSKLSRTQQNPGLTSEGHRTKRYNTTLLTSGSLVTDHVSSSPVREPPSSSPPSVCLTPPPPSRTQNRKDVSN